MTQRTPATNSWEVILRPNPVEGREFGGWVKVRGGVGVGEWVVVGRGDDKGTVAGSDAVQIALVSSWGLGGGCPAPYLFLGGGDYRHLSC